MPWLQEGCQDQLAGSASMDGFIEPIHGRTTWLPETCWATSRREIKNTKVTSNWFFLSTLNYDARSTGLLNPSTDALPANQSWQRSWSHDTYQHEAITSRSRQLLMMGTWSPETCWATSRREIKNTKVTSSWFFLSTLNYDSRSTTHQSKIHEFICLTVILVYSQMSYTKFDDCHPVVLLLLIITRTGSVWTQLLFHLKLFCYSACYILHSDYEIS